jgi:DNA polymerase-3 subunit beta
MPMKLKIARATLIKSLAHVQSVVERRNTIPILANVMIAARDGAMTLTATDMELAIIEDVPATTTRNGSCTVPAVTLYEIARKLPDGAEVELDHPGGDAQLSLRAGRYATKLVVLPVEDFPSMTAGILPHTFSLPGATLASLIDHTKFAISTEETRHYLNGGYLHATATALRGVATDGHRLARVDAPLPDGASAMPGVIIPRKTLNELRKLLEGVDGNVEFALSDTRIQFKAAGVTLTSKLIDGSFPDYDRVIPQGNDRVLRIGKKDFADAVARVAAISTDRSRPVKLSLTHDLLTISASSAELGAASEELAASYTAGDMEIGFQARYLTDITDQISDQIEFRFADSSAPAVVTDPADPSALYVLMPMGV